MTTVGDFARCLSRLHVRSQGQCLDWRLKLLALYLLNRSHPVLPMQVFLQQAYHSTQRGVCLMLACVRACVCMHKR